MKRFFANLAAIFTVLVLNSFGLVSYASAMPMASHEMSGMDHSKSTSSSCVILCTNAIITKKEDEISVNEKIDEDEPYAPYYLRHSSLYPRSELSGNYYGLSIKPPPKVPIYLLYGISRR
jgi:hypothetical protein